MLHNNRADVSTNYYNIIEINAVYLVTNIDYYSNELEWLVLVTTAKSHKWIVNNLDFRIWLYYWIFKICKQTWHLSRNQKWILLKEQKIENLNSVELPQEKPLSKYLLLFQIQRETTRKMNMRYQYCLMYYFAQNVILVISYKYKQWITKKTINSTTIKKAIE